MLGSMGWDGRERRAAKRYGVKDSLLVYRKGGILAWLAPASPVYLLLDVSPRGAHFICRTELPAGQRLRISIDAPALRGTLRAAGRVAWTRRSESHDAWHTGVAFEPLRGRPAALLKNLLDGAILDQIDISTKSYMKQIEKL